eukprot:g11244.t1
MPLLPDVTDSWVDIGTPLGYDTRGNIIQPTSTPVLDEPGGSGTTSASGRWFNLFGSPPAGEGAAVPPQTIKPFGYRDMWKTYDSTPVEVIGTLPDWLFRDGVFYKQAGGAFDIPGTNPPTSGSSVSATTGSSSTGTDNSGPDSKQFLDGLAHVAAWRFVKASASPQPARVRAGKSRNLVLFSNGFPDTEAFEKWHKSGGRNRQFAGTAKGSATYLFNPNVNFQRCDKDLIAPCLIEAPIKTRMVPMDPHSLLTETANRDMNALIQNARDCTDSACGPGHLSFMSTPATSGSGGARASSYEELRADCKMGYRVYKLCHDPEATAPGAGRSASSPSSSTSDVTAGESSQRCCDVLADDVLATCDFPTLFQDKVPAEHCPCMMHTTIETQKYMILAETSLRWRPGKTLQNKILGQLPLIGKRWRVPFFNQFEYKEELPIAFRVYEKKPLQGSVKFLCRIEAEKSGHLFHVANAYDEEANAECNRIVVDSDFLNQC